MSTARDPDVTATDVVTPLRAELPVVLAVSVGGILGAEARYGLGLAVPHSTGEFPLSVLLINLTGSFLLGLLISVLTERGHHPHRLTRPLLGTGVLGGYTTFSTFCVDIAQLVHVGRWPVAALYLAATLVLGVLAVLAGRAVGRAGKRR